MTSERRIGGPAVRWKGYELSRPELETFLFQVSDRIDSAWEEESVRTASETLSIDSYQRVNNEVGPLSVSVRIVAEEWLWGSDEQKKAIGAKILVHEAMSAVLAMVKTAEERFPGINRDELFEESVETAITHALNKKGESELKKYTQVTHELIRKHRSGYLRRMRRPEGLPLEEPYEMRMVRRPEQNVWPLLNILTETQRKYIVANYGLGSEQPIAQREIARRNKVKVQGVSQAILISLKKMRNEALGAYPRRGRRPKQNK